MKPADSVEQLINFAALSGVSITECAPREGFEQFFSFHDRVDAETCGDSESDKLLFQWGAYDWGAGKYFELNITRQFIESELEDDDAISQLSLTFKYEPTAALLALEPGNCWSDERFDAPTFQDFVLASKVFGCVSGLKAKHIDLAHWYV